MFEMSSLLVLRILLLASNRNRGLKGLYEVIKTIEQNQQKQVNGFNNDGKYDSSDYVTVHNLLTHTKKRVNEELFLFAIQAATLTRMLDTYTDFFIQVEGSPPEDGVQDWKMFAGGLLLRYAQAVCTNSCGIADFVEGPEEKSYRRVKFGQGLYPTSSMLNHSCNPNVLSHIRDGNVRAVMSVMFIKKGDQLFTAFGSSYVIKELDERRALLQEHCFFICKCEACVNRWPTPNKVDKALALVAPNATWRCSQCRAVLPKVPWSWTKSPAKFIHVCEQCQKSHLNKHLKEKLQDLAVKAHLVLLQIRISSGTPRDWRLQLTEHLMRLEHLIQRPHPLYVAIQENLHHTFSLLGNYYKL